MVRDVVYGKREAACRTTPRVHAKIHAGAGARSQRIVLSPAPGRASHASLCDIGRDPSKAARAVSEAGRLAVRGAGVRDARLFGDRFDPLSSPSADASGGVRAGRRGGGGDAAGGAPAAPAPEDGAAAG